MRGFYFDFLENGTGLARKAAEFAAAAVLVLIVALPVLAVGARIVA
jgi:hypothetical protein